MALQEAADILEEEVVDMEGEVMEEGVAAKQSINKNVIQQVSNNVTLSLINNVQLLMSNSVQQPTNRNALQPTKP